MLLTSVTLSSRHPHRLASFYEQTLHFPTRQVSEASFKVKVGHSLLRLVNGPTGPGSHHLAFTIPAPKLAAAKAWLGARTELYVRDGQDQFHFDPPFGPADSVYFGDPDGSVLELIARAWPTATADDGFNPVGDIAGLGEVAVPVTSVQVAVQQLMQRNLAPVLIGQEFAAIGDDHGMFILVTPERVWFPTEDRRPNSAPLQVRASVVQPDSAELIRFSNDTVATWH